MIDLKSLKLVIWDLDDTFWRGVLSEGGIMPIIENCELLSSLSEHGIINAICSKNDKDAALRALEELGVAQWFVFNSIDWTPKGKRIKAMLHVIGLRPENCLFIDDNPLNLAEVSSVLPDLRVSLPDILQDIRMMLEKIPANDRMLSRLNHYRVLEKRKTAEELAADNTSFLFDAAVTVSMEDDCLFHKERIYELIHRTNQLNYTKWRCTESELNDLFSDKSVQCGYVRVSDKYGDYGIVGFFALKDGLLLHFLFSCRVLGLGIEQFVYHQLGYPRLIIQGQVASMVDDSPAPGWINNTKVNTPMKSTAFSAKVVFKGNCELKQMSWYLDTRDVKEEFAYVNDRGQNIEFVTHSVNYLSFPFLSLEQKNLLLRECVFADENMFDTDLFSSDIALILLSIMPEANLGVYRHKASGIKIAFGEWCYPLTDPNNWAGYINGEYFTSGNVFTLDWLERFASDWEALGPLSPDEIATNAQLLLERINSKAKVCYILGSEIPFLENKQFNYEGRHLVHAEINRRLRALANREDRVLLIDVNDYIKTQRDFTDNINHFQRSVYYEMAREANDIIASCIGERLAEKSRFYLWSRTLADKMGDKSIFHPVLRLWKMIKRGRH